LGADISRNTHRPIKHYSKVNVLQGRVGVDADPNEQVDIFQHYERTSLIDIIGQSGYPVGAPGFQIVAASGTSYKISKGRYYVDGLLVENEQDVDADKQPDLPSFKDSKSLAIPSAGTGTYLAYLDVWERHITALDDPEIKESALGGADTSTRNKIVWQIKVVKVEPRGSRQKAVVAKAEIKWITRGRPTDIAVAPPQAFISSIPTGQERDPPSGDPIVASIGFGGVSATPRPLVPSREEIESGEMEIGEILIVAPAANKNAASRDEIKDVEVSIEGQAVRRVTAEETGVNTGVFTTEPLKIGVNNNREVILYIGDDRNNPIGRITNREPIIIVATYRYGEESRDNLCAAKYPEWDKLVEPQSGILAARARPEERSQDPCMIAPGAGYRRLENQLYRIEIHKGGKPGSDATFKWSRDNASIESRATDINDKRIMISGFRTDSPLGFNNTQWVEVTDDRHQLLGLLGTLVKVNIVSDTELEIINGTVNGDPLSNDSYPKELKVGEHVVQNNPRVIRWDLPANSNGQIKVETPSTNDGFIPIEDGVEVKFGPADSEYRSGNYWLIPARTIKGDIEWPRGESGTALERAAEGIVHHYSRLALLQVNENQITTVTDCRKPFPPLTNLGQPPTAPVPTEEKLQNVVTRVHGNIVLLKDDDTVSSHILASTRAPTGTKFINKERETLDYVFHFPLSTTTANLRSPAKLTKVYLLFTTNLIDSEISAEITQVDVYDGVKRIQSFRDLGLKGDYSVKFIESENIWEINPPAEINFGLNISAYVRFPQRKTEVIFHGAGAHLEQQVR
jgi:hypothetical protein